MTTPRGTLYLVPNTLDFGTAAEQRAALDDRLPLGVIRDRSSPRALGLREREDDARLPEARRRGRAARAAAAGDLDRRAAAAAKGRAEHAGRRRGRRCSRRRSRPRPGPALGSRACPAWPTRAPRWSRPPMLRACAWSPCRAPARSRSRWPQRHERPELRLRRLPAGRRRCARRAHPGARACRGATRRPSS